MQALFGISKGIRVGLLKDCDDAQIFNVLDYGAIGDGIADDTHAFSRAWEDVCSNTVGTPTLSIPEGKTFLLSPVAFHGPCQSPSVHVEILSNIIAPGDIGAWTNCEEHSWLLFRGIDNLVIYGTAQINGRGSIWWHNSPNTEFDDDEFVDIRNHTDNTVSMSQPWPSMTMRGGGSKEMEMGGAIAGGGRKE
ncbi:hypothetical protein Ancab_008324 [Ancistrocladus abbreviatus]